MPAGEPITEERIERALAYSAYIVTRYGAVYAPLFERLERELADFRRRAEPVERARRYLEAHARAIEMKPGTKPARLTSPPAP